MEFVALTTIAEVGAALAGFATLAGAIRGNAYDIESVYGAVLNAIIALVFALLALRFGGSDVGLRILAAALAVVSSLVVTRLVRLVANAREDSAKYDRSSKILGRGAGLAILSAPPLSILVVFGVLPEQGRLLYESALLCHVLAAVLLLLYVVWRNYAIQHHRPAA